MANRFEDALLIQMGACNPVAVVNTLRDHISNMSTTGDDHPSIQNDPAIRLITHQLAHLMGVASVMEWSDYDDAINACKERASDKIVQMYDRR